MSTPQNQAPQEVIVTISPSVLLFGIIAIAAVSFILFQVISGGGGATTASGDTGGDSSVVSVVDGRQVIVVTARGSYSPRIVSAKGGIPTTLRMRTDNSYGCERAFSIPKMKISRSLPATGDTDIDLGTPEKGQKVFGTCSMGMYTVTINFN